jgi:hypothetical protein
MKIIVKSEDFAEWFNKAIPGAYRSITAQDVRDMTTCGLIGCYGYYMQLDLETVRAILQYEQLRQNRQKRNEIRDDDGVIHCQRCGAVLDRPKGKGRPREYCTACESSRSTMRNRKWRSKMKAARN